MIGSPGVLVSESSPVQRYVRLAPVAGGMVTAPEPASCWKTSQNLPAWSAEPDDGVQGEEVTLGGSIE